MWYSLLGLKRADNEILARVTVEDGSPWFVGHFPGDPILPGIAQLYMVAEIVAQSRQENLCIRRLSRVKFKKIVRPGELLEIHASAADKTNIYTFRITSETQDVCSGTMSLAQKTAETKAT
jgi:3-hydroxymyristoyl/3-hydroxydecanoyl-(acyl carrier protein) dehydratase